MTMLIPASYIRVRQQAVEMSFFYLYSPFETLFYEAGVAVNNGREYPSHVNLRNIYISECSFRK